ncbi:Sapep family Mn(2+)-dependent dipeptidase [Cloacibacillus evryensis]
MGGLNKEIYKLVEKNFDEQLRRTRDMIRIKSVLDDEKATNHDPFGPDLSAALDAFLAMAKEMGFKTKNLANYVGYAEVGASEAPLTGILAHLDVVPEGAVEQWAYPPYEAAIANGCLYGRGSVDDKGPAVAALFAMAALRDTMSLRRRFRLILGLDEENGSRCIKYYKEHEEIPEYSFSPDASFPVVNAEKGILRIIVTIKGEHGGSLLSIKGGNRFNVVPDTANAEISANGRLIMLSASGRTAHAMEPYKGDNAVQKILRELSSIPLGEQDHKLAAAAAAIAGNDWSGRFFNIESSDNVSGDLTCNCAAVENEIKDNAMEIRLKFDIRYPVTANADTIISKIKEHSVQVGASVKIVTHKPPLYLPEESAVIQTLLDAYEEITGDRPKPISMGGGTYCRFMPDAVSAGPVFPGEEEVAHQPNEKISLENLKRGTHIYAEALIRFNKIE